VSVVFRLFNTGQQHGCPPCSMYSFVSLCEYLNILSPFPYFIFIKKNYFILFFIKCKLVVLLLLNFVIGLLLTVFSNKSSLGSCVYIYYVPDVTFHKHFFLLLVSIHYYNYSHELSQYFGKKFRRKEIFKHRT
jgi:hypothetical protein